MANVRYSGGGTSATLGTKEITENGLYNASSDDLDGYSSVTVDVPEPSGSVNLQYTANGTYMDVDVESYETANITVNVPSQTIPTQEKDIIATTSQQVVTPDGGYLLNRVTVDPQRHMNTYTPATDTSNNDMGIIHNYRYVDTSGMITPAGTKEVEYTTNGTHTEDIKNYENIDIEINVPVSGDLGTKTIISNGVYQAIDDNLDGYSEVNVNVPQNATLGIKTITNNGNYYANTDGYDGYSRVDVNVAGATLQTSKSVTATTSQQTVTPDQGYDGMEQVVVNPQVHTQTYTPAANTAANDMGAQNNYRYVDTSGMVTPTSITPSNSSPAALTSGSAVTPTANGYAIASYSSVTPSNSSPVTLTSGDIVKLGGNGKAVASVTDVTPSSTPTSVSANDVVKIGGNGVIVDSVPPTPTNITPSNASPVVLTANTPVNPTANGYAIESYRDITPSDAFIPSLSDGDVCISHGNGYAIKSYSSKTPSDSNPPSISAASFIKSQGNGYLYSSIQKFKQGSVTLSTSSETSVNLGFKPKYLCVYSTNSYYSNIYDENVSTTSYIRATSSGPLLKAFNSNYNGGLVSINSTGFTCRTCTTSVGLTWKYIAIG